MGSRDVSPEAVFGSAAPVSTVPLDFGAHPRYNRGCAPAKEEDAMDDGEIIAPSDDRPPVEDMQIANMDGIDYLTLLMESRILQLS